MPQNIPAKPLFINCKKALDSLQHNFMSTCKYYMSFAFEEILTAG